jgi:hypothetical protein
MANFSLVVLDTNVRISTGVNSVQVSTLDSSRKEQADLVFAEHAHGVQVIRDGVPFALVPWGQVRQAVYAETRAVKK